jgi:hypothetical protein
MLNFDEMNLSISNRSTTYNTNMEETGSEITSDVIGMITFCTAVKMHLLPYNLQNYYKEIYIQCICY